jgi:hypothetical protein
VLISAIVIGQRFVADADCAAAMNRSHIVRARGFERLSSSFASYSRDPLDRVTRCRSTTVPTQNIAEEGSRSPRRPTSRTWFPSSSASLAQLITTGLC